MSLTIEKIGESAFLGEGPHWDQDTQSLYSVDIYNGTIYKYTPSTKKYTKAVIDGGKVSFIIPVEGAKDKFVITINREVAVITWDGESETVQNIEKIGEVDTAPESILNRINDGKADPTGRLWFGTIGHEPEFLKFEPNTSSLYSLSPGKIIKKHLGGITISNGLAWNTELKKMYYIDSPQGKVFQFDYDFENGTISNQETVFTLAKHNIQGLPDGQTIDTDGNLWVAIFDASGAIKIDPRRPETLLQTVKVPAKQTTSVTFGGPNLDELYITSASFPVDGVELKAEDGHGYTYVVKGLGVKGFPGNKVKL